ncbi:MAG: efflux RND transporter periplasmic adaptor subunit [Gammaproteobacteria bacterium]|nr:efflux RND transporter periplasmic adaptor subunit [Gammaproteobacteria bacterium]
MKALAGLFLLLLSVPVNAAEPVPVTVKALDKLWLPQQHNAPAQILSLNTPDISAEISAPVIETSVNVGDVVSKGDVLIKLDCKNYLIQQQIHKASLKRSASQLAFARSQLVRAINLKKKNSISDEVLDQRRTEVKVALADKTLQEQNQLLSDMNVDDCEVKAQIAGVITQRMVSAGDYATIGQALVSLVDMSAIEVEADLNHAEIHSLQQADEIFFVHENRDFALQLKTVVRVFDYQSATAKVRLRLNQESQPWPGSEGRLKWQSKQSLLPAEYISRRENQLGVFHVIEDKAVFTLLDKAIEGRPAIVDLPANVSVVIEGRHRLNDADIVDVVSKHR